MAKKNYLSTVKDIVLAETVLSYSPSQKNAAQFHALRTGQIAWEATLDISQHQPKAAEAALDYFIKLHAKKEQCCVLITHGKGTSGHPPLIKNLLNEWLPYYKEVISFVTAQPKDGGAAAVYVLLKKMSAPTLPTQRSDSFLVAETKAMERNRRLLEQQGERQLGVVKARDHSQEDNTAPSPEGELQNTILQHPELNSQRFDGVDPNLNPEPPLNSEARREFDNEQREQEMEKQLRLGNMPKFSTAPTPKGP